MKMQIMKKLFMCNVDLHGVAFFSNINIIYANHNQDCIISEHPVTRIIFRVFSLSFNEDNLLSILFYLLSIN